MLKQGKYFIVIFFFIVAAPCLAGKLSDMWGGVIKKYPPPVPTVKERQTLASVYSSVLSKYPDTLFSKKNIKLEEIETQASQYYRKIFISSKKANLCKERIRPFRKIIKKASENFDVPEEVIGAVILQESSGNPKAKAKTSSAKGLMQTIDSTFLFAKKNLAQLDIHISDAFKPEDSIRAGTWYLSYVFEMAKQDFPEYNDRSKVDMWKKALEYYYAGPAWGKNPKPIFHVYINGKKITIKKDYYATNVLSYAYVL